MTGRSSKPDFRDVLAGAAGLPRPVGIELTRFVKVGQVVIDDEGALVQILDGDKTYNVRGRVCHVAHFVAAVGGTQGRFLQYDLERQHELVERLVMMQDSRDRAEMELEQAKAGGRRSRECADGYRRELVKERGLSRVLAFEERVVAKHRRQHPEENPH